MVQNKKTPFMQVVIIRLEYFKLNPFANLSCSKSWPTERETQLRHKRPLICPRKHLVSAQQNEVGIELADCLLLTPSREMQLDESKKHALQNIIEFSKFPIFHHLGVKSKQYGLVAPRDNTSIISNCGKGL